jgi:hypothetical protein
MQGHVALGPSQVQVKIISIDLEDRIRALIKAIVETTDVVALNSLGADLQRLLVLERTLAPIHLKSERR